MMGRTKAHGPRGGPIVMLALVLGGWASARVILWDNPYPPVVAALAQVRGARMADASAVFPPVLPSARIVADMAKARREPPPQAASDAKAAPKDAGIPPALPKRPAAMAFASPSLAPPAALRRDPPFLPAPLPHASQRPDRWSLDSWAFWRQGSDAAPVSQGRVPIYGASQVGALLQYRLAPASGRDPRLYARAYRAMVRRGEEELALGASFRPVARVPLRIAGELRLTDAAFRNELRPSAYAVTEIAPIALPHGARLEAYAQAGWVGGTDATAFADGQASITREIEVVGTRTNNAARLTLGAGAWGGAQEGAHRIDVGPTLRLDLTVAQAPLRVSVDWRERVAGEAAPASGLAATVSARF